MGSGAELEARDGAGRTALEVACTGGWRVRSIRALLQAGARACAPPPDPPPSPRKAAAPQGPGSPGGAASPTGSPRKCEDCRRAGRTGRRLELAVCGLPGEPERGARWCPRCARAHPTAVDLTVPLCTDWSAARASPRLGRSPHVG